MAKYKVARGKPKPSSTRGLIPCLILIVLGTALACFFFYIMLKPAGS